ncbi:unnamed protein product [Phytophthora fragariaefolia]|uniref:Unnamed protein product n=1 Tax=Phytophthora fragariaefolia TaxID=1490495 RepID=A0A9W6U3S0_9STRA|nr:unnamed protein product [Phytophthora fragariaefolia]
MAHARKDLLDHVEMKPEGAAKRETETWKAADFKAMAVISKLLSPVYQSMIRECKSVKEVWETLREFFVKQNLHNRVQPRKQLHDFQLTSGTELMDHLLRFDDLCLRLSAVGDKLNDDEKLVILLGSLSIEYDAMVKIIEAHSSVTLMDAREMLRRESETLKKREKQEEASNVSARGVHGGGRRQLQSPTDIVVASGQRLRAMGVGTVRFRIDSGRMIKVTEVLYVPDLDRRLLSIPSLVAKGASVEFSGDGCTIRFEGRFVAHVEKRDKLFVWNVVETADEERMPDVAASAELSPGSLWHERLGHVSKKKMVLASRAADGVLSFAQDEEGSVDAFCAGCLCGKMAVSHFSRQSGSVVKTAGLLGIVHSDVMGPMKPQSHGGARFVVAFVDDYSRYVHVYLIKAKLEVFARFKEYKALVEAHTGRRIRCLCSDNGGEYVNKQFGDFIAAHGIVHQTSTPYTPQQNGLVMRMNRTLVEMARSMLYHRGMAREWWGDALRTAVYVTNRVPNTARPQSTPLEVFTGHKPDLSNLRVFGSRGFVHVDKSRRSKWDARAHACIFLGYAAGSKAYRVWDVEDERVVTTRTVVLAERPVENYRTVVHVTRQAPLELDDDVNLVPQQPVVPVTDNGCDTEMAEVDDNPVDMEVDTVAKNTLVQSQHGGHEMSRRGEKKEQFQCRRQFRILQLLENSPTRPLYFNQLLFHHLRALEEPRCAIISYSVQPDLAKFIFQPSSNRGCCQGAKKQAHQHTQYPTTGNYYTSDGSLDEPDAKRPRIDDEYGIALAASESIPNSFGDAMRSPESDKWKEACCAEIRAHVRNHTWDLVYRPPGVRVIGQKWVFALKRDEHGNIIRYKARLVALGCFQTYGVDYMSTYSPVASLSTVRIFLAVSCQRGDVVKQYDVETAFLNGDLEEEVYMVPPEGINVRDGMVCRLRRSLYGLKQAAVVWHKTIRSVFIVLGFKQSKSDPCLFVRVGQQGPVYIVLYVDDLLVGCATEEEASSIAEALGARFQLESLGDARIILGMELHYNTQKGGLLWVRRNTFRE